MATRRGGSAVLRKLERIPELLAKQVLPGAARTGAKVIADGAKLELGGKRADTGGGAKVLIADAVTVRSVKRDSLIVARVLVSGPSAYVGRWLEYGTSPHFISVDPAHRQGMTARRTNKRIKDGDGALHATLMINGKAVSATVHHPGSKKAPFLRPALDKKHDEAIAAAQACIVSRISRSGIVPATEEDGE